MIFKLSLYKIDVSVFVYAVRAGASLNTALDDEEFNPPPPLTNVPTFSKFLNNATEAVIGVVSPIVGQESRDETSLPCAYEGLLTAAAGREK